MRGHLFVASLLLGLLISNPVPGQQPPSAPGVPNAAQFPTTPIQQNSAIPFRDPRTGQWRSSAQPPQGLNYQWQTVTEKVYVPQTVSQVVDVPKTTYKPVVKYEMQPRWINRWNPFKQPSLVYDWVPKTNWIPETQTVQQMVTYPKWVPVERQVQIPQVVPPGNSVAASNPPMSAQPTNTTASLPATTNQTAPAIAAGSQTFSSGDKPLGGTFLRPSQIAAANDAPANQSWPNSAAPSNPTNQPSSTWQTASNTGYGVTRRPSSPVLRDSIEVGLPATILR